jgi:hypothetical protein
MLQGVVGEKTDEVAPARWPAWRMTKTSLEVVTPFDWRRFTAKGEAEGRRLTRPAKKLTAQERIARILAHRWGNPYCKPGAA